MIARESRFNQEQDTNDEKDDVVVTSPQRIVVAVTESYDTATPTATATASATVSSSGGSGNDDDVESPRQSKKNKDGAKTSLSVIVNKNDDDDASPLSLSSTSSIMPKEHNYFGDNEFDDNEQQQSTNKVILLINKNNLYVPDIIQGSEPKGSTSTSLVSQQNASLTKNQRNERIKNEEDNKRSNREDSAEIVYEREPSYYHFQNIMKHKTNDIVPEVVHGTEPSSAINEGKRDVQSNNHIVVPGRGKACIDNATTLHHEKLNPEIVECSSEPNVNSTPFSSSLSPSQLLALSISGRPGDMNTQHEVIANISNSSSLNEAGADITPVIDDNASLHNNNTINAGTTRHQAPNHIVTHHHNESNNNNDPNHLHNVAGAVSAYLHHVEEPQNAVLLSINHVHEIDDEEEVTVGNELTEEEDGKDMNSKSSIMKTTNFTRMKNNVHQHLFIYVGCVICILLLILVLVPTFLVVNVKPSSFNTTSSSSSPASQKEKDELNKQQEDYLMTILTQVSSLESLQNPTSPQRRAYRWIKEEFDEWHQQLTTSLTTAKNDNDKKLPLFIESFDLNNNHNDVKRFLERYILAVLYYATSGKSWRRKGNFLSHEHDVCDWMEPDIRYHIKCYGPKVSDIDFYNIGLEGSIPNELWHLEDLEILRFAFNSLIGTIPTKGLANVTKLKSLELMSNQLSSTIPKELTTIKSLNSLQLDSNNLSGTIPVEFLSNNDNNLTWLSIHSNQLSGTLPSFVGSMSKLTGLSLHSNQLTGTIPSELGHLTKLQSLNLGSNKIHGTIPSSLGNFTWNDLTSLSLSELNLSGTIPSISGNHQLKSLQSFYVNNNTLTGTVPTGFEHLEQFWIWGNNIEGDAEFLCTKEVMDLSTFSPMYRFQVDKHKIQCSCCGGCSYRC